MFTLVHDFVTMLVHGAVAQAPVMSAWSSTISTAGAVLVVLWIALVMFLSSAPKRLEARADFQRDGKFKLQHNLDWAPERRKIFAEFEKVRRNLNLAVSSWLIETEEAFLIVDLFLTASFGRCGDNRGRLPLSPILCRVSCFWLKQEFKVNSRGVELFTKSWLPESGQPKGIVCYCHGYGDTVTFFFEGIARRLAAAQYAVFGMDYEGFGLSSGLHGYIEAFDLLVDDVIEHYSSIREQPGLKGLPCFLFGESMGGAIALKAHLKQPKTWDGAILVAPMCKIADDMYPPWVLIQILKALVPIFPRCKIIPQRDLAAYAFREPEKRRTSTYNVVGYGDRPRLRTAWELLVTTEEIEARMKEVSLPLLILHGADDKITDPSVSKALYDNASSTDKKLHLYEGVWHGILEGEPDETIDRVMGDICSWLDLHCNRRNVEREERSNSSS